MISYESLGTPCKAKFDQGVRDLWVLSFPFERMNHLNMFLKGYSLEAKTAPKNRN